MQQRDIQRNLERADILEIPLGLVLAGSILLAEGVQHEFEVHSPDFRKDSHGARKERLRVRLLLLRGRPSWLHPWYRSCSKVPSGGPGTSPPMPSRLRAEKAGPRAGRIGAKAPNPIGRLTSS